MADAAGYCHAACELVGAPFSSAVNICTEACEAAGGLFFDTAVDPPLPVAFNPRGALNIGWRNLANPINAVEYQ